MLNDVRNQVERCREGEAMDCDRDKLEQLLSQIPRGRVTRHGILARELGTIPRAVARIVCRSNCQQRIRVVMKGGLFPHQDNIEDCKERARILESEGLNITSDRRGVCVTEDEMWKPTHEKK